MMFVIIYSLVFVVFAVLSKIKFKHIITFSTIFTFLWCLFGSLSTFGFYNLRVPSVSVHLSALFFVCVFNVAFLIFAKKKNVWHINVNASFVKRANVLQIITMILSAYLFVKMAHIFIATGSLSSVRDTFFSKEIFSSEYLDILFRIVPVSLMQGLVIIYIFCFYQYKKMRYLLIAVLDALIVTMVNGGRYAILLLIYCAIAAMIKSRDLPKNKIDVKNRRIIGITLALSLTFMVFITIFRGQDFIRTVVVYFSGSFSFLDLIYSEPTMFALNEQLYGYLTFGAFFEPIVLILKVLGLTDAKVPQWYFNIYCQHFYSITSTGTKIYINNNTTIIYYFLRDFGQVGPLLGGLIFGLCFAFVYNKSSKNGVFIKLLFMYLCSVVFNTVMTYQMFGLLPFFIILSFIFVSANIQQKGEQYASFNHCAGI